MTISIFSLLIAVAAMIFSFLAYGARNRPFVGVKSLSLSEHGQDGKKELTVDLQNLGEVPAVEVVVKVDDSGGLIEHYGFHLGGLFPGQILSAWIPVPEELTYAPDKDLSYSESLSPEVRQRKGLGPNAQRLVAVYPEGHEATLVTCSITYKRPLMFGFIPARAFHTIQPFHVDHSGRAQPARSRQAKIT